MTDTTTRDILARLAIQEERIAAQAAELVCYRAERAARPRRARNPLRRLLVPVALLALLTLAPLGALAANFVDLNPGSGHNANINAIAAAGITLGCFDTSHYCPNDFVTREQMASFLARTAGLGSNAPIANAKTAQTATLAETAKTAQTATLAETANTVPNGAITPAKLGAAGAPAGQVLTSTGGGVAFQALQAHAPTITVRSTSGSVVGFTATPVSVSCNAGEKVTGGGFTLQQSGMAAGTSAPMASPDQGWTVDVMNSSANSRNYTVYAVCLAP